MEWGLGAKKKKRRYIRALYLQTQDIQKQWRKLKGLWRVTGHHLASINPLEVEKAFEVLNGSRFTAHMLKFVHLQIAITSVTVICKWQQQQLLLPSSHPPLTDYQDDFECIPKPKYRTLFFSLPRS